MDDVASEEAEENAENEEEDDDDVDSPASRHHWHLQNLGVSQNRRCTGLPLTATGMRYYNSMRSNI